MRGFQNNMQFTEILTADQRRLAERLSSIEKEDANACANCGGEDCICCEIYHDRQKWVSPDELFGCDDIYSHEYDGIDYEDEEDY